MTSLQDLIIQKIPELNALKADTVYSSFNPVLNLFFKKAFSKGLFCPRVQGNFQSTKAWTAAVVRMRAFHLNLPYSIA
jgi:hypothetical protein